MFDIVRPALIDRGRCTTLAIRGAFADGKEALRNQVVSATGRPLAQAPAAVTATQARPGV